VKHLGRADTQAEIIQRVRTVRPDSAGRFGAMSAPEMIVHCADCLGAALGLRSVSTGGSVIDRAIVKYVALYVPLTWPPGYPTRPEVDPKRDGSKPGEFVSDVAELVRMLERFGAHQPVGTWRPHPTFGSLTEWQWHRWGYLHTDHHLRQFGA
jgi:Protein of unknown function (DUF1569)